MGKKFLFMVQKTLYRERSGENNLNFTTGTNFVVVEQRPYEVFISNLVTVLWYLIQQQQPASTKQTKEEKTKSPVKEKLTKEKMLNKLVNSVLCC